MNSSLSRELAVRYLEGKCTIEEIKEVELLLKVGSNGKLLQQIMDEHWSEINDNTREAHSMDHVLRDIRMHINLSSERTDTPQKDTAVRQLPRSVFLFWKVAASLLILLVAGATLYYFNASSSHVAAVFTDKELKTATGEITTIKLPDGTIVWLNANSTLRYDAEFSGATRNVYLEGEAYFDVHHNPEKPFVVHAVDLDVKVLGTAFNVKSYPNDKSVETTLLRGKVVIENIGTGNPSTFELAPNERAVYTKDTKKLKLTKVVAELYTSWLQAPLIFEEETLDNVIQSLERRYNVKIHIAENQSMACKLTARIRNESLKQMLELLKSTTSIAYTIEGDEVFIEGKMCD